MAPDPDTNLRKLVAGVSEQDGGAHWTASAPLPITLHLLYWLQSQVFFRDRGPRPSAVYAGTATGFQENRGGQLGFS